jgi:hypothetical protein
MPIPPSLSVVSLYHIGKESVKRRLNGGGFRRKTSFKKLAKANFCDKKHNFPKEFLYNTGLLHMMYTIILMENIGRETKNNCKRVIFFGLYQVCVEKRGRA